jgi:hypothetical protein
VRVCWSRAGRLAHEPGPAALVALLCGLVQLSGVPIGGLMGSNPRWEEGLVIPALAERNLGSVQPLHVGSRWSFLGAPVGVRSQPKFLAASAPRFTILACACDTGFPTLVTLNESHNTD